MTVRDFKRSDLPALQEMAEASGCPYPECLDNPMIEAISVVVDEKDRPIMACAVERIIQGYLFTSNQGHPAMRLHAMRLLHQEMAGKLRSLGYNSCEAFLPPKLELSFGKRLERCFGWTKNWSSWCRHF